jgi:hypothetical protein
MEKQKNQAAVALGKLGGRARSAKLSKEEMTRIGRLGALTRWSKRKEGVNPVDNSLDSK